jgi:heme a synthase
MATASSFLKTGFPLLTKVAANPYSTTGKWLLGVGGMVVGMIHVGGVTRLTQSGLSMTSWSFAGSLPPLNDTEWTREFDIYKQYPEYQQRKSMTLSEFQCIFWWEYGHRMLGRVVGVAFCAPWLYFTLRRKIPPGFQLRMAALATMGATQGVVGWWMVKSGLGEDRRNDRKEIRVKPIRLASHLSMALATYGALVWTGLDVLTLPHKLTSEHLLQAKDAVRFGSRIRTGAIALTGLTALTVVSGALVAGNDAGRAFNTFPTMDGAWVPPEILELSPWHRNLTENTATVQWNHRLLGTTTAATGLALAAYGLRQPYRLTPQVKKGLIALGAAVAGQFALGVTTLLYYVPISLAAAHQLGSVVVFTSGLYLVHSLKYARPALLRSLPKQRISTAGVSLAAKPVV